MEEPTIEEVCDALGITVPTLRAIGMSEIAYSLGLVTSRFHGGLSCAGVSTQSRIRLYKNIYTHKDAVEACKTRYQQVTTQYRNMDRYPGKRWKWNSSYGMLKMTVVDWQVTLLLQELYTDKNPDTIADFERRYVK